MLTTRRIHQRKKLRKTAHDYSGSYTYFVTICVHNREDCFGEVVNRKMITNKYGDIANDQFIWLQNHYPYIKIPVWVIMPDHVHAIIEIDGTRGRTVDKIDETRGRSRPAPDSNSPSWDSQSSLDDPGSNKIKPLPELLGAYKTTTSKKIHLCGLPGFRWQRSYHERIIYNEAQYTCVSEYIRKNPENQDGTRGRSRQTPGSGIVV